MGITNNIKTVRVTGLSLLLFVLSCLSYNSNAQTFQAASAYGSNGTDMGTDIWVDNQGNTYAVGLFEQSISFGSITLTSAGSQDIYIVKYDNKKNFLWANRIGGEAQDNTPWNSVRIDGSDISGSICVTGAIDRTTAVVFTGQGGNSTIAGSVNHNKDIFLSCYSLNGILNWYKVFGGNSGIEAETGMDVKLTSTHAFVTGQYWSAITLASSPSLIQLPHNGLSKSDIFTASFLLNNGAPQWANYAGGTSLDVGSSLSIGEAGFVYTSGLCGFANNPADFPGAGSSSTGAYHWGAYVAKFESANGNWVWVNDHVSDASVNAAIHFDAASNTLFNAGMVAQSASITAQNGTITVPALIDDVYITAFNTSGNFIWTGAEVKLYGNSVKAENIYDMTVRNSKLYLFGNFVDNTMFSSFNINSAGSSDIFIAEFNTSNGSITDMTTDGGVSGEYPGAFTYDANAGKFSITGSFSNTANIGSVALTGAGSEAFLAQFDLNLAVGVKANDSGSDKFRVFPNPGTEYIQVISKNDRFIIIDIRGVEICKGTLQENRSIDVSALHAGTYFLKMEGKDTPETLRFIKL